MVAKYFYFASTFILSVDIVSVIGLKTYLGIATMPNSSKPEQKCQFFWYNQAS